MKVSTRQSRWSRQIGDVGQRLWVLTLAAFVMSVIPNAEAMPSFARQTGQRCAACHVGGNWPQLTPWGRFFKLSGYTAGKSFLSKEGFNYAPVGILGQVGLTLAAKSYDTAGDSVVEHNGSFQAYELTGEVGTKITNYLGVFYQYGAGNEFPGWNAAAGPIDIRAVHFFHPGGQELLVGVDSNNDPSVQDVWNTAPSWSYPFYGSPQVPGAPAGPMIASLAQQTGSIGGYLVFNREFYVELSIYRVGKGPFRWMNSGTSYDTGAQYLKGSNPYWRAYWTKEYGPNVWMVGTFGMLSNIYPDSGSPSGLTDRFTDTGFDSQYQHLGDRRKFTLRASYIYEKQEWNGSYPLSAVSSPTGNLKSVNVNGAYSIGDGWTFTGGYLVTNGSSNPALYGVSDSNGNELTSKPNTTGYVLEVNRTLTQNVMLSAQYTGFTKFNGLKYNIDGMSRSASDNNAAWLSLYFAF